MKKIKDIQDLVGDTPLIRLKGPSEETGCEIFGKAEFFNPGQSIKDRAALHIIKDAERKGLLKKGGTIVEGTAGNTGIGLSIIGNALGYKTVIVIPETQTQEKKDAIRFTFAEDFFGKQIVSTFEKEFQEKECGLEINKIDYQLDRSHLFFSDEKVLFVEMKCTMEGDSVGSICMVYPLMFIKQEKEKWITEDS